MPKADFSEREVLLKNFIVNRISSSLKFDLFFVRFFLFDDVLEVVDDTYELLSSHSHIFLIPLFVLDLHQAAEVA